MIDFNIMKSHFYTTDQQVDINMNSNGQLYSVNSGQYRPSHWSLIHHSNSWFIIKLLTTSVSKWNVHTITVPLVSMCVNRGLEQK